MRHMMCGRDVRHPMCDVRSGHEKYLCRAEQVHRARSLLVHRAAVPAEECNRSHRECQDGLCAAGERNA